jgi:MATE family multidrug resistance protein
MQVFLDVLVFHLFTQMVGRLGEDALAATTITIRLNMVAFLPMMGIGQAVSILVGQRLGADQPDLAERSTYTGLRWVFGYMCLVAGVYLTLPGLLVSLFASDWSPAAYAAASATVPGLLVCVAIYSVTDSVNVAFSFALRGAGDTRFVTLLTFLLAWPLLVLPTFIVVLLQASLYWAWASLTTHVSAMAVCFYFRFRAGKWKTMRVIEPRGLDEVE